VAALVHGLPGSAPDLLKPNAEELASVTGTDAEQLETDPDVAAKAARTLVDRGVGAVLATLGARGAVLVDADGAWYAPAPPTTVVSTVGAGDCTLFGYLLAEQRGLPAPDRLALAVAYGSAAAGLPGTTIPGPGDLHPERVDVHELD
jgi:1-phosphofructokinase